MHRALLLGVLLLLPNFVLAKAPAPVRQASADLDGDGKPESLRLEVKGTSFLLSAGSARAEGRFDGPVQGLTVVDLAANEPHQEVLVQGQGAGGAAAYRLFRLAEGVLQDLALPPGKPTMTGNGILLADVPMGFWERRDKYLYDAARPGFTEVPQPVYFVGKGFVPEQTLKLLVSRGGEAPVTEVPAKTPVVLLAFSPAKDAARQDDSQGWYLVLTRQHLLGWVKREALGAAPRAQKKPDFALTFPMSAYKWPELYRSGFSEMMDINGDGKPEDVSVHLLPEPEREQAPEPPPYPSDAPECLRDDNAFEVTMGKHSLTDSSRGCVPIEATGVVDLDTRDRSKEILVYAWGGGAENDDVFLYRWTSKKIQPIEGLDPSAGFPGNGTVVYLRDWDVARSVYDPGKSALVGFAQEWSYFGLSYTVKQSFPLLEAPDKAAATVANVRVGSTVILLATRVEQVYAPQGWRLFKSETGLLGWALSSDELLLEPSP